MYCTKFQYSELQVSKSVFIEKALFWANKSKLVAYYNPNNISYPYDGFEHLLATSNTTELKLNTNQALDSLRQKLASNSSLLCGYLTYDLKNQIERLASSNQDYLNFPSIFFFEPEVYISFNEEHFSINSISNNADEVLETILQIKVQKPSSLDQISISQRVSAEQYKENVEKVKQHILEGNVYELNYCMEFYAKNVNVEPLPLYLALNEASPTPFSGFLKCHNKYLLCASPERFLKKTGSKLISQPIKGTIKRGATPEEDTRLQEQLRNDEKELAENMMIVDLVRNDLSRSCEIGTVKVEEMFGIYGFQQVSQMISTISGQLKTEKDLVDALKGAFPMGSMTGAPKISAMDIIDQLEVTKRGLYSGAFGYIKPNQDCDFNVVIRSIQYNASTKYLSFMVGSAITYDSDPIKEYEECLLKAKAILKVLTQSN